MQTQTLIEAISNIKSKDYKVRFSLLMGIYSVFNTKFSRVKVLSIFDDIPASIKWVSQDEIDLDGVLFKPKTLSDFISIVSSRGYSLSPRLDNNVDKTFLILWKRRNGK